ncbi:hypothetical protein VPH35_024133 [Triticum aestivum]
MDGFSFYVMDVEEKTIVVMDPAETSIHDDEMSVKHEGNTTLVLKALRKVLRNHFADWDVPELGWSIIYAYNMNEPCDIEDSWIYLGHYWRTYNGLYLKTVTREFAYEVISMKGNKGELPSFMIEEVLF